MSFPRIPMDLSVIYYTSNYMDDINPYFINNVREQLLIACDGLPIISVSQKPIKFGENVCVGDIGRSHLNIYRQILRGAKEAKTKYVAMAEDDIFYSWEHLHAKRYLPPPDTFMYDMNRISIFTWSDPPIFSYRYKRMVVNQLIAPREMLIEALEERFAKFPDESKIHLKVWGDPGRYENSLGVTVRKTDSFMCTCPSIVFSHEYAYGYMYNQGKRKRLGDLRILELPYWGRPEDMLKRFYDPHKTGSSQSPSQGTISLQEKV